MKKNKVKPPKYPTFYMWDSPNSVTGTIAVWYPDNSSEYLNPETNEWVKGDMWFASGPVDNDVMICEIKE